MDDAVRAALAESTAPGGCLGDTNRGVRRFARSRLPRLGLLPLGDTSDNFLVRTGSDCTPVLEDDPRYGHSLSASDCGLSVWVQSS